MSISFSGLASGLDTSSWVESLVALKKAKVTTLEEEKKEVQSLQKTLTQIKSFFSSFRSMLEKVTDAKFGIASMDLFAQNLAKSSNLEALTASATTEAEEATYNVLVDKLASETKANSNYSYMTTIVQTTTATGDSKLINLGVKTGTIGVTVKGVEHGISITENDTLSTFIEKLKNIGVKASFNENSGIFSIDVSADAINDRYEGTTVDKTGIKDALHLRGVNEGYKSDSLTTSRTDTIFSAATETTKLSELGVKDGIVTITANGANYSITINGTTTLGEFIEELNKKHIDATLDKDGVFTISDAEITNEGTTDIKNALGLNSSIYGKTQVTGNLTHQTTITETTLATSGTLLKDLEGGKNIKDGDTIIVKNSNNEYTTITVGTTTTLGNLIEGLSKAGLYAAVKSDGTMEITGGTIEGGTFKAEEVLGLTREPYSAIVTGKPLTETVEVHKLVDLQTKLVDDLKVKEGYLEVTDANGNKYYEKIYSGQTIADFMTDMGNLGIQTSLDEETGVLTITGGAFKTLSDADVKALVANATIVEPDTRYQQGTNLLACLYGADTISTDQITVASTYSKTKALRHTVTNTINATKNTTLDKLGLSADGTATFDVRGESRTINLTTTMTISDLMNQLKDAGIGSSFNEDTSRLTIENATITGGTSDLATVLDLTTTISGKYVTSSELYVSDTITVDATRDTLLKDYGISDTMSEADRTVTIYNSDGSVAATTVVGEGTTIGNLMDFINNQTGISASLKDGFLTINNGYIGNATLEASMGLSTSNKNSYALGSIMTVTTVAAVTGETTLGSIFSTLGTLDKVKDGYNLKFNNKDIEVSASTTLNELINAIYENGGTASLDHTGRLSVEGGTLTGSVAQALGITSYTHTSSVSATGEKLYVTDNVYADRDTKLSDLGITGETSYTIYNSLGQATTTVQLANTATIGDFLDGLKTNGIDGIIANGVIKLNSAEGNYIQGALATSLGLSTITVTEVVSTTQMSTAQVKHTATLNADLATTMGELGVADPDNVFSIYDKNDQLLASFTITDASTTIEDFFNNLKAYDIVGSINNGVISLYSPSGNYIAGTLADKLGIATAAGENRTMTVGTTVTSTIAVTYTQDVKATEDMLLGDFISIPQDTTVTTSGTTTVTKGTVTSTITDKNGNVLGTISVDNTTTFGNLFQKLGEYGIDADIHDGVIKLTSPEGNIISGGIADALGITTQTITTTKTVGASVASTAAVTYTSTIAASLTTKISDLTGGYKIDGTITASGVTGTIIGISTADDMVNLAKLINAGNTMSGKTFVLTGDIDMSGVSGWHSFIDPNKIFMGTFDGQGHTISNLDLSSSTDKQENIGLFGRLQNTTVKNLTLANFNYEDLYTASKWSTCAFLAHNATNSTISNVHVTGATAKNGNIAGLVYNVMSDVTIENCSTDVTYTSDNSIGSSWQFSGLVMDTASDDVNLTISGCSANVNASGYIFLGSGLVGYQGHRNNTNINISNSTVTGSIASQGRSSNQNTSVSGICGIYADTSVNPCKININNCYINADLSSDGGYVNYISGGNSVVIGGVVANINASNVIFGGSMTVSGEGVTGAVNVGSYNNNGNFNPDSRLFTYTGTNVTTGNFSTYANSYGFSNLIWNSNGTLKTQDPNSSLVMDKNGQAIASITVGTNDTMETLISKLSGYGNANLSTDGVLTFKGNDGNYITGPLAETLGISVSSSGTTTVTVGATMTSTAAITYTSHETATLTTKLGDIVNTLKIDGTITADGVTGTIIGISTAQDLVNLAALSKSNDFSGKTFVLTGDIDMSGVSDWQMIGNGTYKFAGTFDGQGHTISNLKIEANADNRSYGLFAYIKNGTIKNLALSDFTFNLNCSNSSSNTVGALSGRAEQSNIQNVNVTNFQATLTNTSISSERFITGGIVGSTMHITISDSSTDGSVTGNWTGYCGGIAGNLQGNSAVTGCSSNLYIKSTATNTSDVYIGIAGIAGYVGFHTAGEETTIANCLATGAFDNDTTTSKGGFVANIFTYNSDIQATLNINNSISDCANALALIAYAEKGFNNSENNSNTTINITNSFGTNSNGKIVDSLANAVLNNNNSSAGNYSKTKLLDLAKSANYDAAIWDLNNLSLKGTSSSPYALNIFNPNTGNIINTTLSADSTIQDMVNALSPYGKVSFADGVLSFEGNNGAIITGGLANALGIKVNQTVTTATVANTVTSTGNITYTETITATTSTKLGSFCEPIIDGTITADGVTGTVIGISTAQDLVNLAALSKSTDFSGKTFVLTNDIDMSGVSNWQMIGRSGCTFGGTFDGQNHTISGLSIGLNSTSNVGGLFQYADPDSVLKNVNLDNFTINIASGLTYACAGALVGRTLGTVENVHVNGFTLNGGNTDNAEFGGIASYLDGGTIKNSSAQGDINWSNGGYAGGIVGCMYNSATIYASKSEMNIQSGSNAGGIAGYVGFRGNNHTATISNCLFNGKLLASNINAAFVGSVFTYQDNYNATLNINNSISKDKLTYLIGGDNSGFDNPTNSNSNTTINVKNAFGVSRTDDTAILKFPTNATVNVQNSGVINVENGNMTMTTDQKLVTRMAGFDQSIWQLYNKIGNPSIDIKSHTSPYELNVVSSSGSLLLDTTLNADSTIQDVISALEPYGGVTFADGVLTFNGNNGAILSGGLAEAFGITIGSNGTSTITHTSTSTSTIKVTQTVSTTTTTTVTLTGTVGLTTSSSSPVTYIERKTLATTSSSLSDIYSGAPQIIYMYDKNTGSVGTIPINPTTVQDVVDTLSNYGTASFTDGRLRFTSSNYVLLDASSYKELTGNIGNMNNAADFFGVTTRVTSTAGTQKSNIHSIGAIIEDSTTLYEIFANDRTFSDDNHSAIMISSPSGSLTKLSMNSLANKLGKDVYSITMGDLTNELAQMGITMTYSNSSVTINPNGTDSWYIADWNDWQNVFGFSSSTNLVTTAVSNSDGKYMYIATAATINNSTTFGELNKFDLNNDKTYTISVSNSLSNANLTFSSTSTMSDVFSKLAEYNISGSISNGIVTFNPQGEYYITDGNALSYLNMTGSQYTVTAGSTTFATKNTKLCDIEGTSKFDVGEFNLYIYDKSSSSIITERFNSIDTIDSLINTLSHYGRAEYNESTGQLSFTGGDKYRLHISEQGNDILNFLGVSDTSNPSTENGGQRVFITQCCTALVKTTSGEEINEHTLLKDIAHDGPDIVSNPSLYDIQVDGRIITMTEIAKANGTTIAKLKVSHLVSYLRNSLGTGALLVSNGFVGYENDNDSNKEIVWNKWADIFNFETKKNYEILRAFQSIKTGPSTVTSGSGVTRTVTTTTTTTSTISTVTTNTITTTSTVTNLYNTSGTAVKKTQTTLLNRTDVTFGELMKNFSSGTIQINNQNGIVGTISVTASSTLDDLFTQLAAYDIQGNLVNGKVTIKPLGDNYIQNIDNKDITTILKLPPLTANAWHTVQITTTYANTTSSLLTGSTLATINTSTKVSEIADIDETGGILGEDIFDILNINDGHGNITQLTITSSTTIDDLFTQLAAFDILGTISDGKVQFESKGEAYISDYTSPNGVFHDMFKLGSQSYYTTSITTGHTNTASKTLKEEATRTITSDTKLGELGINLTALAVLSPDINIILDENGNLDIDTMKKQDPDIDSKYPATLFSGDNTLGDVFTWLASHNISASIFGGQVVLNDTMIGSDEHGILMVSDGDDLLQRLNLSTKQADYMTTKTSTTLANTTSGELNATVTKTMTTSTSLGDLGNFVSLNVTFTQDDKDVTLTFKSDDTVDDMLTALAGYGISGQVVDGKISLTGNKHTHITSISAELKSALKLGDNLSYSTVITEGTTVNTDSNKQTYEDTNAKLTGDTIISSIDGFNNGNGSLIVHKTDGTYVTISVDASKTLDEFFEQISQYGIIGSVDSQGVVTITGVGNAYLQQDTNGSNILEALKLSNVVTNVKTVTVNRTSDTLSHVSTVAAKGTTTLENLQDKTGQSITFDALGKAGLILHAYSDAGNTFVTLNFSKTDTIYDVIDKLAEYGVDARLDADGRFSISSSTLTDFDLSGDLGTFLMGTYTKNYGENTTHNVSTLLVEQTITKMTDASKLTDFGITGGDIRVIQEGKSYTVNVDMTKIKTIGDFRSLLAQYGFNSYIDDAGRLNVLGIGNSTLEQIDGGSNILDRLGLLDWTKGEITQSSSHLTDTNEVIRKISMSDKLKDLTNSAGVNLGITAGQIYVYQDGTRSTLNIDINDTLETLAAKLSQYGISVGISQEGKLYFDGNNNSYLTTDGIITANASNILQKFDISGNWSTRYDSTSKNLNYTENEDKKVSGSTKLSDLKDVNGNNLGITTGSFYVYNSGVRNTETITDDMTVNDLMSTLAKYGLVADFDENGVMSVGAYNNTYLATSALAGDNSNIVNTLFEKWNFVNIYKSNHLDIPTDEIRAITRDTKLADINEGTYKAGYITVVKDGVKTNIELTENDTVGTLMDELALYGFESVINDKGQLMIKNTGDSLLQKYGGTGKASNALELLGIDLNSWIKTNSYDSKTLNVTSTTTKDVNASRDTLLSELGVSTGEYYIYNNGVKYTAMISSDETLGSFMDTLKSFGIETSLVDGADGSVLTIIGKGDAYLKYIKESELKAGQSNVVEKLFGENTKEAYEYKGLEQTSSTTIIENFATEDTLVSEFNKPWNGQTLESAGDLVVEVNGQKSTIKISADETFGSLLEKFRALGLEATMSKDGQIMIQSGYDTMTILQDGTTSNLLGNINLQYKDDLGGYSASSTVLEATTSDIVEKTISVANYADGATKMGMLNISDGSLTVYRDGQKATIQIKADETFDQLRTRLSTAFADLDLTFENGYLKIYSKDGKNVEVGSTTDTSNFSAITGIQKDVNGNVMSARELYCVNGDSTITASGIFRRGDVTKGTFTIGNAVFTIDDNTTLSSLIAQINSSDEANATAFWDNVDGQFVIKSRSTGAALVNIEAGTSNFTDIMGFTTTGTVDVKKDDGSIEKQQVSKMNISTQKIGENAKVKINGTTYTATSNTITSDITRIKGLTINLKGLTKDSAVTLKVERDKETLANAVSGVVDSYNELMKNVDEAIASDGDLKNESTLKLIRNQLRNLMTSSDAGTTVFRNLDSIGIGVAAASGNNIATTNSAIVSLAFDKDKFLKAYEADQDAVKELIIGGANNKGIFTKVEDLVESTLKSVSGYFASTETSYTNKIKDLDKKITKANRDVDRYKARLEAKFQSMDMLIAQMQQQYSSFLTT